MVVGSPGVDLDPLIQLEQLVLDLHALDDEIDAARARAEEILDRLAEPTLEPGSIEHAALVEGLKASSADIDDLEARRAELQVRLDRLRSTIEPHRD
ncbi:MAG: hypothetical protein JWN46_1504 [Acidimicrobiales bacterium]|nr:hypothetical protein [Acidimicrobiales bacterium]